MSRPGDARGVRGTLLVGLGLHAGLIVVGMVTAVRFGEAVEALPDTEPLPLGLFLFLIPFTASGAVLAWRLPRNPIGWLLAAFGLLWTAGAAGANYGFAGVYTAHGPLPAADLGLVLANSVWFPAFVSLGLVVFLFPTGRPLSPGWRYPMWVAMASVPAMLLATVFDPGPLSSSLGGTNPLGLEVVRGYSNSMYAISSGLLLLLGPLALASLLIRYRRSRGAERQQIKWLFTAVVVAAAASMVVTARDSFGWDLDPVVGVVAVLGLAAVALIPVAIAIAVLRYGLYELGRIVNRAVMYAVIVVILAVAYGAGVVILTYLLPVDDAPAVALTTLGVAAAFDPLRRSVRRIADRRLHRSAYDPDAVAARLSRQLRDRHDTSSVATAWTSAVAESLRPDRIGVWLSDVDDLSDS